MSYKWYNNGKRNKKIYENDQIPIDFVPGYILLKGNVNKLKKLDKLYQEKKAEIQNHFNMLCQKKLKELETELLIKQKKIFDF